eukprot:c42571_g1_i1 orf=30-227(+)
MKHLHSSTLDDLEGKPLDKILEIIGDTQGERLEWEIWKKRGLIIKNMVDDGMQFHPMGSDAEGSS